MLNLKKLFLEKYLLIFSLFSFIYLWDIKYDVYFEARYLIVTYLIYIFLNNNKIKNKYILYAFVIFILFFLHQFINIFYENNNSEFKIISRFNNNLIDNYSNELKNIYFINNIYNLKLFRSLCGLIICFIVSMFVIKQNYKIYNLLFIPFIIFFFLIDFVINLFSINQSSPINFHQLCVSHFTIESKFLNIFSENSHFGMIISPIIIYVIHKLSKNLNFINVTFLLILFITIYFNISATVIFGSILSIIVLNIIEFKRLNNKFRVFSIIFISYFLLLNSFNHSCTDRLTSALKIINNNTVINNNNNNDYVFDVKPNKYKLKSNKYLLNESLSHLGEDKLLNKYIDIGRTNLTVEVLVNSLNISVNSIIDRPLGWGLNRFHSAFIYYQPRLFVHFEEVRSLNFNDGVSNFSKIVVEFGIFSFILFFIYIRFSFSSKIDLCDKLYLLPFIITQMIRGAGYFNGGFILITILIILKVINLNTKK